MIRKLLASGKKHVKSLPLALWGILLLSLMIGITGLRWGAPHLWHPDEFIRLIFTMGQNLDPNPHYFSSAVLSVYFGATLLVPYYGYLLVFRPEFISSLRSLPYAAGSLSQVPSDFLTNSILAIRFVSVVFSLLSVLIIYLITNKAFNKRTALLSSFLLALSPLFIPHAKFATFDISFLFFLWMSLFFQQRYLDRGGEKNILGAALFVGLAMACKYTGIFGALYLLVVVLLKEKPRSLLSAVIRLFRRDTIKAAVLVTVVFLVANPWPILAFKEVIDFSLYHNLFDVWTSGLPKAVWNPSTPHVRGWVKFPPIAFQGLTPPIFLMALFGMAVIIRQTWRERGYLKKKGLLQLHLLLWLLFFYIVGVGAWVSTSSRYLLPIVPALVALAASALERIWMKGGKCRATWRGIVLFILIFAIIIGTMAVYEFTNESRHRAGEWLEEHLGPGATIGFFSQQAVYLPPFPTDTESIYLDYIDNMSIKDEQLSLCLNELTDSGPDYLVLTSFYYTRFAGPSQTQRTEFYDELLQGRHPVYNPVAEFRQHDILGYSVPMDFVSPTIVILRRGD